ncbi:hypothetical protein KTO58_23925 [Chitinophaga pendula]|uniref:hypothetical protein n=1 Tax=Chitinophaga TaxID=79328 RepID=UPI000BAECE10|nr:MULTISPECIES: hypothetical protein [Chitinophaga]ASZ10355.1 hypothetical protein CK934_04840 [Chitinophaga sp. MD30]UCJ06682.1 hypothetical protein KTO58_23925 [Chitinophaga pendula]
MNNNPEGSKEYWELFNTKVRPLTEKQQRMITYNFCLLTGNHLDELGKGALQLIKQLTTDHPPSPHYESYQKKLQQKLPNDGMSVYSPLIWALMPGSTSYPVWYAAAIVGLNIAELQLSTLPELTRLTIEILDCFAAK